MRNGVFGCLVHYGLLFWVNALWDILAKYQKYPFLVKKDAFIIKRFTNIDGSVKLARSGFKSIVVPFVINKEILGFSTCQIRKESIPCKQCLKKKS